MTTTYTIPFKQTEPLQRPAARRQRRSPKPAPRTALPLLDWIATELQCADRLDDRSARRTARQLLDEAFASVDQTA